MQQPCEVCPGYRLRQQVFSRWRDEFVERAPEIFATDLGRGDEQERIADLARMVGRLSDWLDHLYPE